MRGKRKAAKRRPDRQPNGTEWWSGRALHAHLVEGDRRGRRVVEVEDRHLGVPLREVRENRHARAHPPRDVDGLVRRRVPLGERIGRERVVERRFVDEDI